MTAEEKAFLDKIDRVELEELMYDEFYELIIEAVKIGYKKAMRFRDPKEELPKIGESVIVKYRTAKNVEKHGVGKYFDLGIGNPWIIEGSTSRNVIGWRPIE
ncbi:hypothetical protein DSECCO2_604280 [anaerobic digester metagenome]